jgi:hypothetical protein
VVDCGIKDINRLIHGVPPAVGLVPSSDRAVGDAPAGCGQR